MSEESIKKGRLLISPKFEPPGDLGKFDGFDYVAVSEEIEIHFYLENIGDVPINTFILSNIFAFNLETQNHFMPVSGDMCSVSPLNPDSSFILPLYLKIDRCMSGVFSLHAYLKSGSGDFDLYRDLGDGYELVPGSTWKNSYRILSKIDAQEKRQKIDFEKGSKTRSNLIIGIGVLGIVLTIVFQVLG